MLPTTQAKAYDFMYSSQKIIDMVADLSCKLQIIIHLGSVKVPVGNGKFFNQSIVFDNNGQIIARYNKIHLFDALVTGDTYYRESDHIQAGNTAIMHQFSDFKIGYTICYDVRFSALYTLYSDNKVDMIAVPAAFTVPTGQAHWEVLLRSRAIENCCYIVASAQCGTHYPKRQTYGHAMIINPWGTVLSQGDSFSEMIIYADIDKKECDKVQNQMNITAHRLKDIGINSI
jgi:predicted amidohydrolase